MNIERIPQARPEEPFKTPFVLGTYKGELRGVLQRKVNTDGALVGAEVLVRSADIDTKEMPKDLLEHLETHNETHLLTLAMFRRSCEQIATWNEKGIRLPLSVNIEVCELTPGLAEELDAILESTGVPRECVELELTERTRLTEAHREIMEELRSLGIRLALDDYGTGEADEEALKYFKPGDTVKIDRRLVEDGTAYNRAEELIRQGYHVVLEGVPAADMDKVPAECDVQSFEVSGKAVSAGEIEEQLLGAREEERKAA